MTDAGKASILRIVLLTGHSKNGEVQHRYVASKLAQEFPNELAAIIVATGVRRTVLERVRRWRKRYTVRQLASRIVARAYRIATCSDSRRQETFRAILFPDGEAGEFVRPDLVRLVPSHNGPECLGELEQLQPNIVIVYGTLIIGKKVIATSGRILNLHTGLSPTYRGSDTIFWPLHNGEPQNLGVTIHRLDAGIDSGAILARGKPKIEPGDNEDRLFAKAVQLGAELLCRAIRREAEGSARPLPQELHLGREYQSVERTIAAELRTRKLLKKGLLAEASAPWSEEF